MSLQEPLLPEQSLNITLTLTVPEVTVPDVAGHQY